jgi:hypothetical protein
MLSIDYFYDKFRRKKYYLDKNNFLYILNIHINNFKIDFFFIFFNVVKIYLIF